MNSITRVGAALAPATCVRILTGCRRKGAAQAQKALAPKAVPQGGTTGQTTYTSP